MKFALTTIGLATVLISSPSGAQSEHGHHHDHPRGEAHPVVHPEPRPGISAVDVLAPETLRAERHREAYRRAAAIPQVMDALHCHCDCHRVHGRRSLLDCFFDEMAAECGICQGQARLAYTMHRQGRSLDEIRAAIDDRYGGEE